MQLVTGVKYQILSDRNRISLFILSPKRGRIFDRNKKLLVDNIICFRLMVDKTISSNYLDEIDQLVDIFGFNKFQREDFISNAKKSIHGLPAVLINKLTWQEVVLFEENRNKFQAIFVDIWYMRDYKYDNVLAHLSGYISQGSHQLNNYNIAKLSQINQSNYYVSNLDRSNNTSNYQVNNIWRNKIKFLPKDFTNGNLGIEQTYNNLISGKLGWKKFETDAVGKKVRVIEKNDPIDGHDLMTNIDIELQSKIYNVIEHNVCSVVVMGCNNGEILSLISNPSFDPNEFNMLSHKYWDSIRSNIHKPMINRVTQSLYPLGSVVKMLIALAALEYGIDCKQKYKCTGHNSFFGKKHKYFRCHSRIGHGMVDMIDAIALSCNSYFYHVANIIGADKIIAMLHKFGFGSKTGIDLPNELSGFVPSKSWKKKRWKNKWTLGDTLNLTIGQGFLSATPIQLANYINAIANGGKLFKPMIAKGDNEYVDLNISNEHFDIIRKGMYKAVNGRRGTARFAKPNKLNLEIAAKTGTAQVASKTDKNKDLTNTNIDVLRNHGICGAYFPYDNPLYTILVYYEHGGSGALGAAPIVQKIINIMSGL